LLGVAALARSVLDTRRDAERPGLLQGMDPRAKVASALALVVGIALSPSLVAIGAVAALTVALAALSRLELIRFLGRVWLFAPLFTAAVALPALLNAMTPGPVLLALGRTPGFLRSFLHWPETLSLTTTGALVAARLVLRVGASVSVVALLSRTTAPDETLKATRALGIPRVFVLVALMTERYLLGFVRVVEEMHLGLLSRRIHPLGSSAGRAFVTSRMGVVLEKANVTAEEVHLAMVARGFRGEVRTLSAPRPRGRDLLLAGAALVVSAGLALSGRAGLP
jgi:cobalt/nickel transport system permease protein